MEEQTQLIQRVRARERTALMLSLLLTAVPILLVGTVVGLSVRWIKAADRATQTARAEAARYQTLVTLSSKTPIELANQVLQLQTELADKEQKISSIQLETDRLQKLLNAGGQSESELMKNYQQALDQNRQIIARRDQEIAAARDDEKKKAQQALDNQKKSYEEQVERLKKETELAGIVLAEAKALADKYLKDAQECRRNLADAEAKAALGQSALRDCQSGLEKCQRGSEPNLPEEVRQLRARLQQCESARRAAEQNYGALKDQLVELQNRYESLKKKCGGIQ